MTEPLDETRWDGRYVRVRTLGVGGMGRVMLARDTLQGEREVALKQLLPAHTEEAQAFVRELQIQRQLAHPNIPRAYELGHAHDGGVLCPYFTMEVSEGVPLHDLVQRAERGLPLRAVFQIIAGLLRALDHVHRRGFVHGDVKPGNLLVSDRFDGLHTHLIDFGVAQPLGGATPDLVLATPEYAAPEQLFGEPVDARTDLYAVGLLLYELLEHRRPWPSDDPEALAIARTEAPVPPLTAPGCPPTLAALVRRLLAGEPDERPSSAARALAELCAATGWDAELEPTDAFVQHLLTVPLPWREQLHTIARGALRAEGDVWATIVEVPPGYFARRLLGPVLDEAAVAGARLLPLRFDERFGEEPPAIAPFFTSDPRPIVLVIENIDAADVGTLAVIAALRRPDTRLVATRRDPTRDLFDVLGPGAIAVALEPWTEAAMRAWIAAALGDVDLPIAKLPPTPAALVEALATLSRDGHIVRLEGGYHFRAEGKNEPQAATLDPTRRPEPVDALLACLKAPVPELALSTYLGAAAEQLAELLARGVLTARGDGTISVADEPRRAIAYGRLAPAHRAGLHRRLAQALEEAGASPHRIADEWLASDAPLLAVPHLLAAAELRPGRSWLPQSLALVGRARQLLAVASRGADAPDLELWRYAALVLRSEARIRLACGEPIDALVESLIGIGSDMGHRHTVRAALELRIANDRRAGAWDRVVADTHALAALDGDLTRRTSQGRIHLVRGLRYRAEGLPTAALAEIDAGLSATTTGPADVRLELLQARAELCLEAEWPELVDMAALSYREAALRLGRADHRARATILQAARKRLCGRLDTALALVRETIESMPRQRTPRLDAEVELELGWCHLELGDFLVARDHARFAAGLAAEDGEAAIVKQAWALAAQAAWYVGDAEAAWTMAQRADRAMVLELALAERGFAGADAVVAAASQAGYHALRRMERSRAARAFRIAAEAALVRGEPDMARDFAERSLEAIRAEGQVHLHLPRHIATVAKALGVLGDAVGSEERMREARAEVAVLAGAIADADVRAAWLSHPEQRRVLATAPSGPRPVSRPGGSRRRVRTGSRRR